MHRQGEAHVRSKIAGEAEVELLLVLVLVLLLLLLLLLDREINGHR